MQSKASIIPSRTLSRIIVNQDTGDELDTEYTVNPLDTVNYEQPSERWHTRRENVELEMLEQMQEENGRLKTENEQLRGQLARAQLALRGLFGA